MDTNQLSTAFANMAVGATSTSQVAIPFDKTKSDFHKTNPFNKMPPELNNRIFKLALADDEIQLLGHARKPGLLQASVKIYYEAVELFYAVNSFGVRTEYDGSVGAHWVCAIKHTAEHISRRKMTKVSTLHVDLGIFDGERQRQQGNGSGAFPVDWELVRSLREVFSSDLDIHLSFQLEHPDPNLGNLTVQFQVGNYAEAYASWKKMHDSGMAGNGFDLDLERSLQFDVDDITVKRMIDNMPQF